MSAYAPSLVAARIRRPAGALALVLATLLSACASLARGDGCADTVGQQILVHMNDVRVASGLEALVVDTRLVRAARAHAESMREDGFFGHVGPDGLEPADRVAATGYEWTFVAENLAAGDLTPVQVVAGWMESPLHRDNILEPDAAHVGIAYAAGGSGRYGQYWTAVFADTDGALEAPRGGCHP